MALSLALGWSLGLIAAPTASADPATDGWRDGFCELDEGLTVVVDFGTAGEGREWEARCKIGGIIEQPGPTRVTALEAVGYTVTVAPSGLVVRIDDIGSDRPTGSDFWRYSSTEQAGAWGGAFDLPAGDVTNYFYGVCFGGCQPRVDPQYAPTAQVALTGATKATYGKSATVRARVTSTEGNPTGTVELRGVGVRTAPLRDGVATFTLPRDLRVGTYALTASYDGGTAFGDATSQTLSVTVGRAAPKRPTIAIKKQPSPSSTGRADVRVGTAPGLVTPAGKVLLIAKKGNQKRTTKAKLVGGRQTVTIPKLGKGKWKVLARYQGSKTYRPAASTPVKIRVG